MKRALHNWLMGHDEDYRKEYMRRQQRRKWRQILRTVEMRMEDEAKEGPYDGGIRYTL